MPKSHRTATSGPLRPHSRSSSSSKLTVNLQFTQKEQHPPKAVDKGKKNTYAHDTHTTHGRPGMARVSSAQRVHSRDQMQAVAKRGAAPQNQRSNGTKGKPGFTIASPGDDDEDDDEWVSSESGAATPNDPHSDSESESDNSRDSVQFRTIEYSTQAEPLSTTARTEVPGFPRVDTARPSDFATAAATTLPAIPDRSQTRTPTLPPTKAEQASHSSHTQRPLRDQVMNNHLTNEDRPSSRNTGRTTSKRHSSTRPPSTHSIKGDAALRPHPLIRGHSYGHIHPAKPAPLEPLTVIQDAAVSVSPPSSAFDFNQLSTSPSSIKTSLTSPSSPDPSSSAHLRRTSVSSVATLPTHSNLRESANWSLGDRKRTMSSLSHSSSSAALSSLVHLPTVTRPPSPQAISFFPRVNPHANIEGIHPLLPGPYLHNHLTVLSRRTPIKESFDRVIRAKHELRAST